VRSVVDQATMPEPKRELAPRPPCPSCGSAHTQPFTHAGPGARLNMRCIDCGHLFREQRAHDGSRKESR